MNRARTKKLVLALCSVAATLLAGEALIRASDHRRGIGFFSSAGNPLAEAAPSVLPFRTFGFDPYRTVGGRTFISDTWKRRFPLRKAEGTYRVVCFGGSTTAHRMNGRDYPGILQRLLREGANRKTIEVINAGNSGYTTAHSLILLGLDVLSWQPDLVVLSHNINDLTALYFPGFRPDYWNKYRSGYFSVPDFSERYTWNNVLFQHARLYWFLAAALRPHGFRDLAARGRAIRRAPYPEELVARGEEIFRRNIETFVAIAKDRDIKVILGTQPHEPSEEFFVRHMGYKPYNDVALYPPHGQHLDIHERYNEAIRDVAEERGVGLVDNARDFAGETRYFIDHVHNSDEGLLKLAELYARFIHLAYLPASP